MFKISGLLSSSFIISLLIFLFAVSGCKKQEPAEPVSAAEVQNANETQQPIENVAELPQKEEVLQPVDNHEASKTDADAKAENADDNQIPAMPELKTTVTSVRTDWGEIQRTTLDWSKNLEVFCEIPVLKDDITNARELNAQFYAEKENFFSPEKIGQIWEYHISRGTPGSENDMFKSTRTAEITELSDKYISAKFCTEWFMGGVYNDGCSAMTLDINDVYPVALTQYLKKDIASLRKLIGDKLTAQLKKEGKDTDYIEWENLNKMDDFHYYIQNGKVHVVFMTYEIACGAAGSFDIEL